MDNAIDIIYAVTVDLGLPWWAWLAFPAVILCGLAGRAQLDSQPTPQDKARLEKLLVENGIPIPAPAR